jgi:hypothetical protein
MKHVGKMKNNAARIVVAYRTLPGDPHSCLVVGTSGLGDSYHDTLMSVVESDSGQQSNELADILSVRRFPDGSNMLGYLHANGHLIKVKTSLVSMTPDSKTSLGLDEMNRLIAESKGVSIEDLAVNDGSQQTKDKKKKEAKKIVTEEEQPAPTASTFEMTPAELRSRADALFKQAQVLRKQADDLDPPKKKATTSRAKVEKVIAE